MRGRVPSTRFVARTSLARHVLRFHKRGWRDGTGKANAFWTGRDGDEVHGVIYRIEPEHLAELDRHERGYRRDRMLFATVPDGRAEVREAWVYVAEPDAIDDALVPEKWYVDHVLRGARAHGLPTTLISELEGLVVTAPRAGRSSRSG